MARIPTDTIERIKRDISLLDLVQSQGYTVTRQGKDHAIRCPFHEDDTPSLIISPNSNLYHCFGCNAAGSVIDWAMHTQTLSFREAAVWLKNQFLPVTEELKSAEESPSLAAQCSVADDQALLKRVMAYYHDTLKKQC